MAVVSTTPLRRWDKSVVGFEPAGVTASDQSGGRMRGLAPPCQEAEDRKTTLWTIRPSALQIKREVQGQR